MCWAIVPVWISRYMPLAIPLSWIKKLNVLLEISFSAPKISNINENELENEANFIGNVDTFDTSKMIVIMNALFA